MRVLALLALLALDACRATEAPPPAARAEGRDATAGRSSTPALAAQVTPEPAAAPAPAAPPPTFASYPWSPSADDRLDLRFPPPAGFVRVPITAGTFAAFLRPLPLLGPGAPVVDHRGKTLYASPGEGGPHENIAAVVDIDVGARDLQQCADAVVRMHAEWRYARGDRDLTYLAASGTPLSYRRWLAGERAVLAGGKLAVVPRARAQRDEHRVFRAWLDEVFAWTNTAALERDAAPVALSEVRAGDFFVLSGVPFGHAVLVLDVARDERGRLALLLGQSFMPAQSFHVLRPSRDVAWFVVDPTAAQVKTPFWAPFPASSLRRFP
jgi:hypothetical protein